MKRVLVTGANRGIDFAIASGLEAKGFDVVIGSRNLKAGRAAAEIGATAVQLDVANPASIEAAVSDAGAIDVLVNNGAWSVPSNAPLDAAYGIAGLWARRKCLIRLGRFLRWPKRTRILWCGKSRAKCANSSKCPHFAQERQGQRHVSGLGSDANGRRCSR